MKKEQGLNPRHEEQARSEAYEKYIYMRKLEDIKKHWWTKLGKFLKIL